MPRLSYFLNQEGLEDPQAPEAPEARRTRRGLSPLWAPWGRVFPAVLEGREVRVYQATWNCHS